MFVAIIFYELRYCVKVITPKTMIHTHTNRAVSQNMSKFKKVSRMFVSLLRGILNIFWQL